MAYKMFDKAIADKNRAVLFLDFDGTLSPTEGGRLVFTPLYKKLTGGVYNQIEKDIGLVPGMVERMRNASEEDKKIFALTEGGGDFLRHACDLIDKGHAVDINIISKNHFVYIRAVLESSGKFTSEQLDNIKIAGVEDGAGWKDGYIINKLEKMPGKVSAIVCDDNKSDCDDMKDAATKLYGKQQVSTYNAKPGQFNWHEISQKLDENLGLGAEKEFQPT